MGIRVIMIFGQSYVWSLRFQSFIEIWHVSLSCIMCVANLVGVKCLHMAGTYVIFNWGLKPKALDMFGAKNFSFLFLIAK